MNTRSSSTPTKKYKSLFSAIHSVYRLVNSTYEVKDLLARLPRLISQILGIKYCQVLLLDSTKKYSLLKCTISAKDKHVIDQKDKISNHLHCKIINRLVYIKQDRLLGLPLVSDDVIGLIIARRSLDQPVFDKFDQDLFTALTEQITMGIRNLRLYEEQQKFVLGSIKSLVTLLDTRIPREYTHSPYFSRLVVAIAEEMNLEDKQRESLRYASLLHDAGKIEIPPEILKKTTKLTPQEYKIIRRHPIMSAQIIRPLQLQAVKPVIPIIMHHHEKYNGTGYPSRLKKSQIPIGARIMAVADAFEAMAYGRPYRERMDVDSAFSEIRKKSGTQFDPKVVDAFFGAIKKQGLKKYLELFQQKRYNKSTV